MLRVNLNIAEDGRGAVLSMTLNGDREMVDSVLSAVASTLNPFVNAVVQQDAQHFGKISGLLQESVGSLSDVTEDGVSRTYPGRAGG